MGTQERGLNWGSIRAPDELVDEGHLNDRGFWVEVPHPELDRSFKYPGPADVAQTTYTPFRTEPGAAPVRLIGIYNGSPWRISRRPCLAEQIADHQDTSATVLMSLAARRLTPSAAASHLHRGTAPSTPTLSSPPEMDVRFSITISQHKACGTSGSTTRRFTAGNWGFKGRSWLTWRNREWCRPPRIIGLKHVLRRDWIVFMSAATAKPCWHILLLRFEHLIKLDVAFLHEFIHLLRHRPDLLRHWVTFAVG